ncbi:MAG: 30S ribosomal protein S1, partial [Candidatus Omnitrophica bacterium]|nr:30S ribosomal protein S1 [Candidatus Omnitrophota bacterium]
MLNMTDNNNETNDLQYDPLFSDIDNTFEIDYDKTFKTITEGEIVKGTIASIGSNAVVVDIAYKSEGTIPAYEFNNL